MVKYHRGRELEDRGRCMGRHCLICYMNGRKKDLYGNVIQPCTSNPKQTKEQNE